MYFQLQVLKLHVQLHLDSPMLQSPVNGEACPLVL